MSRDAQTHLAEALLLLEDYALSFKREMSLQIRAVFNGLTPKLAKVFSEMPRERAIARLRHAFESRDFQSFVKDFRDASDDMDKQFLKMREARKHIFDWDINDWNCAHDLDLELHRCDEMVNWKINEPDTRPPYRYP